MDVSNVSVGMDFVFSSSFLQADVVDCRCYRGLGFCRKRVQRVSTHEGGKNQLIAWGGGNPDTRPVFEGKRTSTDGCSRSARQKCSTLFTKRMANKSGRGRICPYFRPTRRPIGEPAAAHNGDQEGVILPEYALAATSNNSGCESASTVYARRDI